MVSTAAAIPPPPSYHTSDSPAPAPRPSPRQDSTRAPTEHTFSLPVGGKPPWVTLKVVTAARQEEGMYDARSATKLPTFLEGEPMKGSVELSVKKLDGIDAIDLWVKGHIITGVSMDSAFNFLYLPQTLWSKAMGTPAKAGEDIYVFPFSFALPRDVAVEPKAGSGISKGIFRLPPTVSERHTKATTQYDLTVHIRRKGVLRSDSKVGTMFAYIPSIRPDPPSQLRARAYETRTPLAGPETDKDGWKALNSVPIKGKVFSARSAAASCTLFVATPLSFTRGTTIPLYMHIQCDDPKALDVLSSPNAIFVRLRRTISYRAEGATASKTSSLEWKDHLQDYELAAWWPAPPPLPSGPDVKPPREDESVRRLEGEIKLPKELVPSAQIALFSISYALILFPFDAPGFESASSEPLLEEPVEIGTVLPRGPPPRMYGPPEYRASGGSATAARTEGVPVGPPRTFQASSAFM